jgi:RNA polymerase sigma-70 factor (ECF subfamily)
VTTFQARALPLATLGVLAFSRPRETERSVEVVPTTFESLYEAHYRDVYRHVLLLTRGRDDVDEITSEVFTRAFEAWRNGRGPAGRALPWLLVIAKRLITDRWRRRRLITWLPITFGRPARDESTGTPRGIDPGGNDPTLASREFWLWLDALAAVMPERQREVLFLRYQRDLDDEEIGEILGLSASGVRSLASRALTALRRHPELWS